MFINRSYPIVIQNGYEVVHEISVCEWQGKRTYAMKTNGGMCAISEENFEAIISEANKKGYYIFNYGTFD